MGAAVAGGLVGPAKFTVMPDITPVVPMAMIMLAMTPTLYTLWKTPNAIIFVKAVTFCSLCRYHLVKPRAQNESHSNCDLSHGLKYAL